MRRIFVVGAPRSGTTLLQSLLGCSPDLATFPESHFFSRAFTTRLGWPIVVRSPKSLVRAFCAENGIANPGDTAFGLDRIALSQFDPTVAGRYFIAFLDSLARAMKRNAWLEKTPYHLHRIAIIEKTLGNDPPDFIHIVRDGVDVAASHARASRQWGEPLTPARALARWQEDIEITRRYATRQTHHVVFYDDVARAPEETVLKLGRRLCIRLTASDLDMRGRIARQIVAPSELWKRRSMRNEITALSPAEEFLSKEERAEIEKRITRREFECLRAFSV